MIIEWALVGLMWIFGLTALACAVALCLSYRRPPEPAKLEIPDFVPEDWGPKKPMTFSCHCWTQEGFVPLVHAHWCPAGQPIPRR